MPVDNGKANPNALSFHFQSQNLNYHEKRHPCLPQELGKPGSNKNYLLNM